MLLRRYIGIIDVLNGESFTLIYGSCFVSLCDINMKCNIFRMTFTGGDGGFWEDELRP